MLRGQRKNYFLGHEIKLLYFMRNLLYYINIYIYIYKLKLQHTNYELTYHGALG